MNNIKGKGLIADPSLNMKIAESIKGYLNIKADIIIKYFIDYPGEEFEVACMTFEQDNDSKRMVYNIYIPSSDLVPEGLDEVHKFRISEFLKGLEVEENSSTISICHILHEFGHVFYIDKLLKHDCGKELQFVTEVVDHYTGISFNHEDMEDMIADGVDAVYWLRPQEMFADSFMYMKFMPVFKYLKEEGLIDNE